MTGVKSQNEKYERMPVSPSRHCIGHTSSFHLITAPLGGLRNSRKKRWYLKRSKYKSRATQITAQTTADHSPAPNARADHCAKLPTTVWASRALLISAT